MNKLLIIILVVSIVGNLIGLYFAWEFRKQSYQQENLQDSLKEAGRTVDRLTTMLDRSFPNRMVFLHHSVGKGILYQGGLADSLANLGIFVHGATYGDEIGERTDMCNWTPKFQNDMQRILVFKGHPNVYYTDGTSNDVVMFKSCFPNSFVESDGTAPGDPTSLARTVTNYKATFGEIGQQMRKYPQKLFVYLTYPPLTPKATQPEAAARAREFNRWLIGTYLPAYRSETGLENFVIFDLFDLLADENNVLKAAYRRPDPGDSHPNEQGNRDAAAKFMEFFRPVWTAWSSRQPVGAGKPSL